MKNFKSFVMMMAFSGALVASGDQTQQNSMMTQFANTVTDYAKTAGTSIKTGFDSVYASLPTSFGNPVSLGKVAQLDAAGNQVMDSFGRLVMRPQTMDDYLELNPATVDKRIVGALIFSAMVIAVVAYNRIYSSADAKAAKEEVELQN